jgi:Family of unknown function (DUF6152)
MAAGLAERGFFNLGGRGMRAKWSVVVAGLGLLISAPVFAHHSFEAEYDANKPIKVTGTVTKLEWMNPHARFYVDVKDEKGTVTNWNFELGSPNVLKRQGWQRDSLKVGDSVTVEGYLAKDGSMLANARRVTLSDGRKVFAGSAGAEGGPQQ